MKFVFFGTPRFAAIILGRLIEKGTVPSAVVTNPDRPAGRKKIITPCPVKQICRKLNPHIPILQPEKIDSDFLVRLREYSADVFIVAAYGKILPKNLIEIPIYGTIGVHPSLLPILRGATPIQSAILTGLEETGVTLFLIDEKMDHGPIISSRKIKIDKNDNSLTLSDRLAIISSDMIEEIKPHISSLTTKMQDESKATYVSKFTANDAFIPYSDIDKAIKGVNNLAEIVNRKIRGFNPEPGAWTIKENKRMKLLDAEIVDNKLILKSIQIAGKKPIIIK